MVLRISENRPGDLRTVSEIYNANRTGWNLREQKVQYTSIDELVSRMILRFKKSKQTGR